MLPLRTAETKERQNKHFQLLAEHKYKLRKSTVFLRKFYPSALKIQPAVSYKTLVIFYQTTRCDIQKFILFHCQSSLSIQQ